MDTSGCRGADNNPIESIMARVEVVDLETYKDKASTKKPGQFMYHRFSYDTKSRLPKESEVSSAARFCTCQQPENPDRLMVCCESCSTWFHGGAHAKQADLTFSASWLETMVCVIRLRRVHGRQGRIPVLAVRHKEQEQEREASAWAAGFPVAQEAPRRASAASSARRACVPVEDRRLNSAASRGQKMRPPLSALNPLPSTAPAPNSGI